MSAAATATSLRAMAEAAALLVSGQAAVAAEAAPTRAPAKRP